LEAVIFIGLQAAGKSSFYRERYFRTHVRLNLDMLRTRRRLEILLRACFEAKQPFVIDNTNLTAEERGRHIELARAARFSIAGYYFASTVEACRRRNAARPEPEQVPPKAIYGAAARLQLPSYGEGFDALFVVRMTEPSGFAVEKWRDDV
jgi:predicted kinase